MRRFFIPSCEKFTRYTLSKQLDILRWAIKQDRNVFLQVLPLLRKCSQFKNRMKTVGYCVQIRDSFARLEIVNAEKLYELILLEFRDLVEGNSCHTNNRNIRANGS